MESNRRKYSEVRETTDSGDASEGDKGLSDDDQWYNPNMPNVFQTGRDPGRPEANRVQHGQSEVITSGGRRYVAQLYEDSLHADQAINDTLEMDNTNGQGGSQVAKTLCINLLSELVKGSYQLLKANTPEEESCSNTLKEQVAKSYARMQDRIDVTLDAINDSDSDLSGSEEVNSTLATSVPDREPPEHVQSHTEKPSGDEQSQRKFKKAKQSSDIKGCSANPNSADTGSSSDTSTSKHELENSESERKRKSGQGAKNNLMTDCSQPKKLRVSQSKETEALNNANPCKVSYESLKENTSNTLTEIKADCARGESKIILTENQDIKPGMSIIGSETHITKNTTDSDNVAKYKGQHQKSNASRNESTELANRSPTTAPREGQLSFLDMWQNHHIAKAIVDNAINKTLDEMALGPHDRSSDVASLTARPSAHFVAERQRFENAGVSQVISQRGLQAPPATEAQNSQLSINPFINQLTEVTEDIFMETLRAGTRFAASFSVNTNRQHSNQSSQNHPGTLNPTSETNQGLPVARSCVRSDGDSDVSMSDIDKVNDRSHSETQTTLSSNFQSHVHEHILDRDVGRDLNTPASASLSEHEKDKDIFDQAIEEAIHNKGLHF